MSKGKELARQMEDFINGANCTEIEDFASEFTRMHNTLEQKAFGMLLKTIQRVSEHKYTDGRNEACVKSSRLLIKGYKSALVEDLVASDSYWTKDKASDWVNGGGFDMSSMPLV
tara:strand:+ start:1608 stop:1949 length:342 start_codon:yes stop_codon:yes gene_type:complete